MDRRTSATALGTGAVIVVAAGLGVSIARTGGEGAVRPAAGTASATPSLTSTAAPTSAPTTPAASPSATPSDHRHGNRSGVPGAARHHDGQRTAGGDRTGSPGTLPFTGSLPLPATTAVGILLALAGSWTLVLVPGGPGEAPVVIAGGAIDRLRAPRRVSR